MLRIVPNVISLFFAFVFFCLVSIFFYLGLQIRVLNEIIVLPRGTIKEIVTYLNSQRVDANRLDSLILRFWGKPQSGWIDLGGFVLAKGDLLHRITKSKSALKEVKLIPGETMYFFFKQIAVAFGFDEKSLWQACYQNAECKEGNFIPQTYKIPYGANPEEIVKVILDYSKKAHDEFAKKNGLVYGSLQWQKLLSKASIIQKEAGSIEEMPFVSAVIDNRIKKGMPLQMDGSLNYGEYSHQKVTPHRIRNDESILNTYKYKGIPAIPCGSVSFEALQAALNPAQVPYLYFVRNKDGKHSFSQTYDEHKKNF